MCGFYRIAFIEYMLAGKSWLDYTNLFSSNDFKNNGNIINKYFKGNVTQEDVGLQVRLKNRWNEKLPFVRNKT